MLYSGKIYSVTSVYSVVKVFFEITLDNGDEAL